MSAYTGQVDYSEDLYLISDPVTVPTEVICGFSILSVIICFVFSSGLFGIFDKHTQCRKGAAAFAAFVIFAMCFISGVLLTTNYKNFLLDKYDIQHGVNKTVLIKTYTYPCYYVNSCVCSNVGNLALCGNTTAYCAFVSDCCAKDQSICYRNKCQTICILTLQTQNCQYTYTQCNTTTVINNVYSDAGKLLGMFNLTVQRLNSDPYYPANTTQNISYAPWSFDITYFPPKSNSSAATAIFVFTFGWPAFIILAICLISPMGKYNIVEG